MIKKTLNPYRCKDCSKKTCPHVPMSFQKTCSYVLMSLKKHASPFSCLKKTCKTTIRIVSLHNKSPFRDTEWPFRVTEWPFRVTEWPFRVTE